SPARWTKSNKSRWPVSIGSDSWSFRPTARGQKKRPRGCRVKAWSKRCCFHRRTEALFHFLRRARQKEPFAVFCARQARSVLVADVKKNARDFALIIEVSHADEFCHCREIDAVFASAGGLEFGTIFFAQAVLILLREIDGRIADPNYGAIYLGVLDF